MKKLLLSSIALCALLVLFSSQSSCKKETVVETVTKTVVKTDTVFQCTPSIKGLWVGTYTVNAFPSRGALFMSLSVYPDGTIMYKSKSSDGNFYYSKGTWTLDNNNVFTANVVTMESPYVTQTITATYSKTGTLTNGTWVDTSVGTNSGNLQSMVKMY